MRKLIIITILIVTFAGTPAAYAVNYPPTTATTVPVQPPTHRTYPTTPFPTEVPGPHPNTGGTTTPLVWIAVAIIGVGAFGLLAVRTRRR